MSTTTVPAPPVTSAPIDTAAACDRCGVDDLGRSLRAADFVVRTPMGDVGLCNSHHAAAEAGLAAKGLMVLPIPR